MKDVDVYRRLRELPLVGKTKTDLVRDVSIAQALSGSKTVVAMLRSPQKVLDAVQKGKTRTGAPYSIHAVSKIVTAVKSLVRRIPELEELAGKHKAAWETVCEKARDPVKEFYSENRPSAGQEAAVGDITWADVVEARDRLPYGSQKRLLFSMYTKISPSRIDYGSCAIDDESYPNRVSLKDKVVVLTQYKTSKKFGEVRKELPDELVDEIRESLLRFPRKFLFTNAQNKPFSDEAFGKFGNKILREVMDAKFPDTKISLTNLRHLYIGEMDFNTTCLKDREAVAKSMMHSVDMQTRYRWIPRSPG